MYVITLLAMCFCQTSILEEVFKIPRTGKRRSKNETHLHEVSQKHKQ